MNLFKEAVEYIKRAIRTEKPSDPTLPPSPGGRGPKQQQGKPRNFGAFVIARIPTVELGHFPTEDAVAAYAEQFGETVRQVLADSKLEGWTRLAIYLPQHTAAMLRRAFAQPEKMKLLEWACEQKLFLALDGSTSAEQRVYVIGTDLDFHAALDHLLKDSVLLRPLRSDEVLVTRDADQSDHGIVQYLVGVLEISRAGSPRGKQLIWAYQVPGHHSRIRVNVDFDLLVKGFSREAGFYPLGLEIDCVFRDQAGVRTIDEVSFDFAQALQWLDSVPALQYRLVTGDASGKARTVDLRNYGAGYSTLKLPPSRLPSGSYDLSPGVTLPFDRIQGIEVGADGRSVTYTFAFFPYAVSYDPRRNVLRLIAQCIPATGGDVFFAPGRKYRAQVAFTLIPAVGTDGGLRVRIPKPVDHKFVRKDRQGVETELQPGQELEVEIGDEITASPHGVGASHTFKLQDLSSLPSEVKGARAAREYVARVVIEAPADRSFELAEVDHVFGSGSGQAFSNAPQAVIGFNALKFHREYLALRVMGQGAFYVAASAPVVGNTRARTAQPVPPEGTVLSLREDYDLFVGDLQFFLSLTATYTVEATGSL